MKILNLLKNYSFIERDSSNANEKDANNRKFSISTSSIPSLDIAWKPDTTTRFNLLQKSPY
jgi:hypothetical protein